MEKRIVLGVFYNEFQGDNGTVKQMKIAHMDPEPGLDENWDGYYVETMNVQQDQIPALFTQISDIKWPALCDLTIKRVAAKTRSGGDAARLQIARLAYVGPVDLRIRELATK